LAALVGAPLCNKFRKEANKINVDAVSLILNYAKKNQKIIYPTTNSGYGIGAKNKYCDEKSPLNPISLYGITKAKAESLVMNRGNSICFRLATVFGFSYRMRTDLLVNNFVEKAVKENKIEIFEPMFRRNYIHIRDVVSAFIFSINNFSKLKNNIYNLGLSSANLTKLALAKKIKKKYKKLKIKIVHNKKDPDQRDYFVSNKKIEKAGFKPTISLDSGISEMLQLFINVKVDFKNNY
jgi:nucleoside-diphosphate-sugar epimerase